MNRDREDQQYRLEIEKRIDVKMKEIIQKQKMNGHY